jgi:hypothetical protein
LLTPSPTSTHVHMCSGLPQPVEAPVLAYTAEGEVNSLEWYKQSDERNWVGIAFDNKMQILRV